MLRKTTERRTSAKIEESATSTPGFKTILSFFAAMMIIIYVVMGVYLILHPTLLYMFPPEFNRIIGGLLIFYGVFRGYRTYKTFY